MLNISEIHTLYVSNEYGDDQNSGLSPVNDENNSGPLKTIEKALKAAADIRKFGALQPLRIRITDEVYSIDKPIVVDSSMSGITVEPYTKTLLSGGVLIDGFKEDVYNGVKCVSADVAELIDSGRWFTDLYVNGHRAKLTCYPDNGVLYAKEVENNSNKLFASSKWFIAEKNDLEVFSKFKNFNDCLISYNHYWIDEHTPIESYDLETGKIVFKYASRFTIEPKYEASRLRYKLENAAEAFKNQGEWYLDRETKRVYYIPLENETEIKAFAPVTDKLIIVKGTADKRVENFRIKNLDMAYTKGEYKSVYHRKGDANIYQKTENEEGFASDIQSVCWAHGSVEFEYACGCSVENCTLNCFGVHGINLYNGCENIRIVKNKLTDGGAGGISVNGGEFGSDEAEHTRRINISGNIINKCGRRYLSACGILIRHAYENTVSHNTISDLYYSGVSIGWVWGFSDSICKSNIIEYNHIYNIGQGVLSDMGGIYLLGKQSGTVVNNNLIHDVKSIHYGGWGIYTDEGSSYITIENNICYNLSSNAYHQHYGSNNVAKNNIFGQSGEAAVKVTRGSTESSANTGMIFENNLFVLNKNTAFSLGADESHQRFNLAASVGNFFFDISGEEPAVLANANRSFTLDEARTLCRFDLGSSVIDPMLENNSLFEINEDSPIFKCGFNKIDMSQVGAN